MNEFRAGSERIEGAGSARIGLVGCVKKKLPYEAAARDLYISNLFRGRRGYVEKSVIPGTSFRRSMSLSIQTPFWSHTIKR